MPHDDPDQTRLRTPSDLPTTAPFTPASDPGGLAPPVGLGVGSTIAGRYELVKPLGEGGMGVVWLAEQSEPVRRPVAIKLLQTGMHSKAFLGRFELERQSLALMDHPNIAKIFDGGIAPDGRPFFVMELVDGISITQYCQTWGLSLRERLELFVLVCSAIQHAHQKGIIHRDIKPSNVLVATDDDKPVPKVIDFGIAKLTGPALPDQARHTVIGAVVGTPAYMSPEQAGLHNLDVDTRTDVYSLGVLLYELLTGTTPIEKDRFRGVSIEGWSRLIREEEPPRPSVRVRASEPRTKLATVVERESVKLAKRLRGELDWIAMRALEKDRTRRYETASALARDVDRYLADEVVDARPPSMAYRTRKFLRKHRGPVLAAVLVLLALTGGVGAAVRQATRAERAELRGRALLSEAEGARLREEAAQRESALRREATLHNAGVARLWHGIFLLHGARGQPRDILLLRRRAVRSFHEAIESLEAADREFPGRAHHAYFLGISFVFLAEANVLGVRKEDFEDALRLLDRAEPLFLRVRASGSTTGLVEFALDPEGDPTEALLPTIATFRYTAYLGLKRPTEALVELDRVHPWAVAATAPVPPGGEVALPDPLTALANVNRISQIRLAEMTRDDVLSMRTVLLRGAEEEQARLPWSRGAAPDHGKAMRLAAYLADTRGVADAAVYNAACTFAVAAAVPNLDAAERDRRAAVAVGYLDRICRAGYFQHPGKGKQRRAEFASDDDLVSLRERPDFRRVLADAQRPPPPQAPPPRLVPR